MGEQRRLPAFFFPFAWFQGIFVCREGCHACECTAQSCAGGEIRGEEKRRVRREGRGWGWVGSGERAHYTLGALSDASSDPRTYLQPNANGECAFQSVVSANTL